MYFHGFNDQPSPNFVPSFDLILLLFPFFFQLHYLCSSFFVFRHISSFPSLSQLFSLLFLVSHVEAILFQSFAFILVVLFSHFSFPAALCWSAMQELLTRNSQFDAECLLSSSYIVEPNQLCHISATWVCLATVKREIKCPVSLPESLSAPLCHSNIAAH